MARDIQQHSCVFCIWECSGRPLGVALPMPLGWFWSCRREPSASYYRDHWPWGWCRDPALGTAGSGQSTADGVGSLLSGTLASGSGPFGQCRHCHFGCAIQVAYCSALGQPSLPASLLWEHDPVAVAQRLQIPGKHQQWLQQCSALCEWLADDPLPLDASPSVWSTALEQQAWQPEAVALVVTLQPRQWKQLLRWWGRWRRIQAPQTARDLIDAGWQPGPAIGEELRRQRSQAQDRSR